MRARWVLLVIVGSLCARGRAEIRLAEYSGQYIENQHYSVFWYDPDPNDPNNPLQPDITLLQDIEGVTFWFACFDNVTGEPADIYGIGIGPYLYGPVGVKVLHKDGVGFGARNVGKLVCPPTENVDVIFSEFNISGTLGTLGVDSHVALINGPFSAADLGEPFHVDVAISTGGALIITGAGSHYADVTVKGLFASESVGDEIQIAGDYLGTLTLGSVG